MCEIYVTRALDEHAFAQARERSDQAGGGCPPSHVNELYQFLALNGAIWCILKGLFFTYFERENGNIPSISSVVPMRESVRQTL